jgi:hypothetical protein
MSNGAFTFFAITLGTISVALAALLVCMVVQGNSGTASASPLLKHATYRFSVDDRAFCLLSFLRTTLGVSADNQLSGTN